MDGNGGGGDGCCFFAGIYWVEVVLWVLAMIPDVFDGLGLVNNLKLYPMLALGIAPWKSLLDPRLGDSLFVLSTSFLEL